MGKWFFNKVYVLMRLSRMSVMITCALAVIVIALLLFTAPTLPQGENYVGLLMIGCMMAIITLNIRAPLYGVALCGAHGIGVLMLLGLPEAAQGASVWVLAITGAVGELIYQMRRSGTYTIEHIIGQRSIAHVIVVCAALTLSFAVGALLLRWQSAMLPIPLPEFAQVGTIIATSVVVALVYYAVHLTEMLLSGAPLRVVTRDILPSFAILSLPVILAIMGAALHNTQRASFNLMYFVMMAVLINAPALVVIVQRRLRQQVEILSGLAVMSKTIRANLNDQDLLNTIYEQVRALIQVDSLYVALQTDRFIRYPLVIDRGQRITHAGESLAGLEYTPLHRVLTTGTALLIERDAAAVSERLGLRLPEPTIEAWAGVPLVTGGTWIGAMVITSYNPQRRFTPDDLRLLTIAAATTSTALENAGLYAQQRARVQQMIMLNQVLNLLNNTLSPEVVIDTVISAASMVAEANAVAVYLYWDDARSTLALVRSAGLSAEFTAALPDPLVIDALRNGRAENIAPVVVKDAASDERAAALRATMKVERKAAWIELPLSFGGVGMGVLTLYYDQPQDFSVELIELLRTFAAQSAQAIHNARLYTITDETLERRVGQLLTLAAFGHELNATMSLEEICDLALDYAIAATSSSAGALFLTDSKVDQIEVLVMRGYAPGSISPEMIFTGLNGKAMRTGEVIVVSDVASCPDYQAVLPGMNAQITVPLLRGRQVIGGLTLEHEKRDAYRDDDTHFVSQLVNQTVIGIENARLFREISEANERMRVILNAMKEAIMLITPEGEIKMANPRVAMLGINPEHLLTHSLDGLATQLEGDLLNRLGFDSWRELKRLVSNPEAAVTTAYSLDQADGILHIERQAISVRDDDGRLLGVLLVFYDQTEEVELNRTREDFSRMLVHDLRSPLTAVMTSLLLLSDAAQQQGEVVQPLVDMTASAGRGAINKLLHRIDAILDIAKLESGTLDLDTAPTRLRPLIENVFGELTPLAQEVHIALTADLPSLPLLDIDADKVERLLLNLLDNAIKFSPQGANVTVRAHALNGSGFARIDVIDAGPGVPDEYKDRLFDRFVQVRGLTSARRGSGLGLTFCRLVTEAHGGKIWIEDNPQGGSIFAFTLPITDH